MTEDRRPTTVDAIVVAGMVVDVLGAVNAVGASVVVVTL